MKKTASLFIALIFILSGCSKEQFNSNNMVHVVSREDGSGTRGAFTELTGIMKKVEGLENYDQTTVEAIITNSTSVVMTNVSGDPHAVGYLSLGSLNNSVKALNIDGVTPTVSNIKQDLYPISRPFLIVSNTIIGDDKEENLLKIDFIDFILSAHGQQIIKNNGYVSISDVKSYTSVDKKGKLVVGGSSSVTPIIEKLKESYIKLNPNVVLEIQQSDSTTGITSVVSGIYDIGMSSRALKASEKTHNLTEQIIAMDGIVVIINQDNPIDNISLEQVKKLFTGEIIKWSEFKGGT